MEPEKLLETALAAAHDAAAVHVKHLGTVAADDWTEKGAADFVTHVDQAAERCIVDRIRHDFPHHSIVAEEAATAAGAVAPDDIRSLEWAWIVDPLDGTTNYLHGYPMYAVSIAVAHRGEPVAGVVLNSASGESWTATRGGGAFRNGQPIRVSGIARMSRALIGTGFPFKALHLLPQYTDQLQAALRRSSGVRRAGSAALDLCHVATGWFDGFWELTLAPWDVAAGALVVREAGGVVTRMDGDRDVLGHGSILAGNPAIHEAMAELLREVDAAGLNRQL
ncbi:MAG TPA: inositol monophosphatase family protein [Longimicrobiales bacterium]|nr:inositol monophosphatase family protein [Longimicrobiales bacterium]